MFTVETKNGITLPFVVTIQWMLQYCTLVFSTPVILNRIVKQKIYSIQEVEKGARTNRRIPTAISNECRVLLRSLHHVQRVNLSSTRFTIPNVIRVTRFTIEVLTET